MRGKIGFIAIGQAGGNIGKLFENKGFSVLYLNTSKEDLQTLKNAKYTYHIKGGEGCNKDRHKAKQLVIDDFENISREIAEKLKSISMAFLVFASGGGTGSGCGPMLADLLLDDIANGESHLDSVGVVTVIPGSQESIKAHINCYECFGELSGIEDLSGTIILDNSKAKGDKLLLNQPFVNAFYNFLEIPAHHNDRRGNIDRAEAMETLKARGMMVVTEVPAKSSTTASVLGSFRDNIFAPMEADRVIKYISISVAGTVDVTALQKETGLPIDIYQTYNEKSTICCLAGLSYPATRLEAVYQRATENRDQILQNLEATARSQEKMRQGVNFLEAASAAQKQAAPKTSRRELMQKYMKG